jgi:ribonuclease HI
VAASSSSQPVLVYADGSCEGNPGPGGWGVVIVTPEGKRRLSGGDSQTTNNRMEIMAAIEALRAIDPGVPVILRSDSQYLVKTMNEGWRRTKNQDLWKQLDAEVARHNVRFEWVRGHAGDALNEEADDLAREAARIARSGRAPRRSATAAAAAPERKVGPGGLPPSSGSFDDELDELILEKLEPMLGPDERIAKCAVCKQAFVARGDEEYCSLIGCQLVKRT